MKILILDDDTKRAKALFNHICNANVCDTQSVLLLENTSQGKQVLATRYFDLVVMDVVLPKRGGESASADNGLDFLKSISRGGRYYKPGKIIGITAYLNDIAAFRERFEEFCHSVIEARPSDASWKEKIVRAVSYATDSMIGQSASTSNVRAITIHGIQTFGAWQNRLETLANEVAPGTQFHSYKYGFFSIGAFFIPFLRNREAKILSEKLETLFNAYSKDSTFVIYAHSFGTYLATNALLILAERKVPTPVSTLVLAATVLPERFSMSTLCAMNIKVVNDCGDDDYVLYLSKALVPGTGMGGRCGLYEFQDGRVLNRYFRGGHSHYFNGNEFMKRYWIPLLNNNFQPTGIDFRKPSFFKHSIADKIIAAIGYLKGYIYFGIFALLFFRAVSF